MKALFALLIVSGLFLAQCGDENLLLGEDHGNIVAGSLGAVITQDEHVTGWGEANCFACHNTVSMHQTDRSGTGLNMAAIRQLTVDDGLESCVGCHGTNGL